MSLLFSVLFCFSFNVPHFLSCVISYSLSLHLYASYFLCISILIHFLLPFPSPFQGCSFTQASSFSSHCRVTDGNLRMKFPPREGAESQGSHNLLKRSCSDARFPVSSPLKLPRQFYEWGGRKVAMTTEGLIVSGAFCWWASYRPQSGN